MKKGGIVNKSEPWKLGQGESVIPTRAEILYFNIKKAKKAFRPIKLRSEFSIVLDEIKAISPTNLN